MSPFYPAFPSLNSQISVRKRRKTSDGFAYIVETTSRSGDTTPMRLVTSSFSLLSAYPRTLNRQNQGPKRNPAKTDGYERWTKRKRYQWDRPDACAMCLWKPGNHPRQYQNASPVKYHHVGLAQPPLWLPRQLLLWISLLEPSFSAQSVSQVHTHSIIVGWVYCSNMKKQPNDHENITSGYMVFSILCAVARLSRTCVCSMQYRHPTF